VYPDALTETNPNRIASEQDIRNAIQLAVTRDPCQMEAWAILAYLTRPDPKEAFHPRRGPTVAAGRNEKLLNLSYHSGDIMPWHAPWKCSRPTARPPFSTTWITAGCFWEPSPQASSWATTPATRVSPRPRAIAAHGGAGS